MNSGQILPVRIQDVLNMQTYQLRMWSLKFNGQDIRVEGFVMSTDDESLMRKVTSDALLRRMTATLLFDRSGSFFELIGPIDRQFQQKSGMKRDLIDEFSEGFPENWGVLLSRCSVPVKEQKSIDNTPPVPPPQKGPFVTLADDHTILETKKPEERQPEKEFVDPNSTFRAPANCYLDAVTPIRWDKKTTAFSIPNRVFEQTPQRNHVPLASSTPQPQIINHQQNNFAPPPQIDQPRFVVPDIEPIASNTENLAAEIEHLFDEAVEIKTPAALRKQRQSRGARFAQNSNISSRNYHDITSERNNTTRYTNDREKSGRKRPHFPSRSRSSEHGIPESRNRYYEDDMRRSRKDMNMTRASSVYQKSVNFEDDRYSRRGNGNKSRMVASDYEYRDLDSEEKYIRERLERTRRQNHSSSSRKNSSYSETDKENSICWEKENEKLLNESIVAGRRSKSNGNFKEPKIKKEKKKAPKRQKTPESEDDMEYENDVISPNVANRRPVRSCRNTPLSDPKPKRVVWLKRELEKLKRIVDMKKPSESEEDWKEVHRLLQSRNSQVDWTGIKQIAIDKSIWKNTSNQQKPEEDNKFDEAEEEEKRRKGVAAAVKEDKKLREQMVGNRNKDVLAESVESVENIEPADISADESFLACTPVVYTEAVRRKGGTRKSVVPAIVDDTPTRSINSSVDQTPKPDATTAKDMETTMKYVHQLASMTNRPGSRANRTNNTTQRINTTIGGKNTSISIAKGAQKALKMVKNDVLEEEEDEEDEETNSDSENESEEEEDDD